MPITRLSNVTRTIIKLIEDVLDDDLGLDSTEVSVTAIPPDKASSDAGQPAAKAVSVHLVHVIESGEYRNQMLSPKMREPPIQQLPLGLILHYVISVARTADTDSTVALDLHDIIGSIARGFHDFPTITRNTQVITGETVLHDELHDADHKIDLILRPTTLEENLNFWATQDDRLARASLFVEARVAILKPKRPTIAPGIVLSVGNFVFPSAGPALATSRNRIFFRVPEAPDPVSVDASPARVALLADVANPFSVADAQFVENSKLRLEGSGFFPGQHFLVLKRGDQKLTIDLDNASSAGNPIVTNENWGLLVGPNAVLLSFRERIVAVLDDQPPAQVVKLVPGIYSARLMVKDTRLPGGARPRVSNTLAFAATPQVVDIQPTAAGVSTDTYELTVSGNYLDLLPLSSQPARKLEIELSIAGVALEEVTSPVALGPGRFAVNTAGGNLLTFRLPTVTPPLAPSVDNPAPVLLVVNGAVAPPRWVTGPGGAPPP